MSSYNCPFLRKIGTFFMCETSSAKHDLWVVIVHCYLRKKIIRVSNLS